MARLSPFLEAQQLAFDLEVAIAEAETEIRAEAPPEVPERIQISTLEDPIGATERAEIGPVTHCEVEALCHSLLGLGPGSKYKCGWIGMGTVQNCPKRKRLNGGGS